MKARVRRGRFAEIGQGLGNIARARDGIIRSVVAVVCFGQLQAVFHDIAGNAAVGHLIEVAAFTGHSHFCPLGKLGVEARVGGRRFAEIDKLFADIADPGRVPDAAGLHRCVRAGEGDAVLHDVAVHAAVGNGVEHAAFTGHGYLGSQTQLAVEGSARGRRGAEIHLVQRQVGRAGSRCGRRGRGGCLRRGLHSGKAQAGLHDIARDAVVAHLIEKPALAGHGDLGAFVKLVIIFRHGVRRLAEIHLHLGNVAGAVACPGVRVRVCVVRAGNRGVGDAGLHDIAVLAVVGNFIKLPVAAGHKHAGALIELRIVTRIGGRRLAEIGQHLADIAVAVIYFGRLRRTREQQRAYAQHRKKLSFDVHCFLLLQKGVWGKIPRTIIPQPRGFAQRSRRPRTRFYIIFIQRSTFSI